MTERRYRADELTYAQMSAEPDWGPRLARASIHEAGHAVVAHALGLDVAGLRVEVWAAFPPLFGCQFGPDGYIENVIKGVHELSDADRRTMLDYACATVGAWEAEVVETGWPKEDGWASDRTTMEMIAARLGVDLEGLVREQRERARSILEQRRVTLRRVAVAALTTTVPDGRRKWLGREEFLEVVGSA